MRPAYLAAIGLVVGCSKILGIGEVSHGDGGASDATPDAPANTVVGRDYFHYIWNGSAEDVPVDLSATTIQALLPDTTQPTGYRIVDGKGSADGTFVVSGVPDGQPYFLRVDRAYYGQTSHTITIRFDSPFRHDTRTANVATNVSYNISNMQPAAPADLFELDSWSIGYTNPYLPPPGAGSAFVATEDWRQGLQLSGGGFPLPDMAQGDDLEILHLHESVVNTAHAHELFTIEDAMLGSAPTLTEGSAATITGTFMGVGSNASLTTTVSRGSYDAGFDSRTRFSYMTVGVLAHPILNDYGVGSTLVSLDFSDWTRSIATTDTVTNTYGDPFPAAWQRFVYTTYVRNRYIRLPGTNTAHQIGIFYSREAVLTNSNASSTPTLLPPGSLKVNDKDGAAGGLLPFDGTAPVKVAWASQATPKMYLVQVSRVVPQNTTSRTQSVANFYTADNSLLLPAEVFGGEGYIVIAVYAYATPNDYTAGDVIPNGAPNQVTTNVTNLFRLSSTCGNGTVDTNEDCDTSGESASCDVDCTPVICGDGIRNAAAGEACDTAGDTPSCDSDCTAVMCGDGHVNQGTEDCDLGSANGGSGCSSNCKLP